MKPPPGEGLAYLTSTLRGALGTLPDDAAREQARACFEHYRGQWQRIAIYPAVNVAHTVHGVVDDLVRDMLTTSPHASAVACRKGCSHCCRVHVDVTPQEAELLAAVAAEEGIEVDRERLERQAAKDVDTWLELAPADRRCVFLGDDEACRVYEHRPTACRKYLVRDDPAMCDAAHNPGGIVPIVFAFEAEIAASAAVTVYGMESMPRALLSSTTTEKGTA